MAVRDEIVKEMHTYIVVARMCVYSWQRSSVVEMRD